MIKAVIYARVSTAEQAEEGYSIDAQIETVRNKCEQEGRIVIEHFIDRGISGKSMNKRLALQQLLKDAKEKKFQEVWVWKTNRLARNHLDLLKIVDELNKDNVNFKSCSESFDTSTPSGKLLMNVLASIGEFERETIVENVKMGMKQRARAGKWNGGQILGYKTTQCDGNDVKTRLIIVQEEAIIVKKIFELYSEGKGLKSITNLINQLGYKTKKGNLFSINAVKEILNNPIYKGKIRYNLRENWSEKRRRGINNNPIIVDGEHEAIISVELWNKVQELYIKKSYKPQRVFDGTYPLTGLLKCPMCGSSMVAGRTKKRHKDGTYKVHRYYFCGAWRNKGIAACNSNGIRADDIEKHVFNRIQEVLYNDKILKDTVDNMNKNKMSVIKPLEEELYQITKSINEFESKRNKVFELYEEGIIDKETLSKRLNSISENIDDLLKNKELIENKLRQHNSEPISFNLVKSLMGKFNELIQSIDFDKKKTLLHLVIKKIEIKNRQDVNSIMLHFNSKVKKYMFNEKEDESSLEDSSSFNFTIKI